MSWTRLLLLGDVGQQLDLQDAQDEMTRLRGRLHHRGQRDQEQDRALAGVAAEVDELRLLVAQLVQLLVAGGTLTPEQIAVIVGRLDRASTAPSNAAPEMPAPPPPPPPPPPRNFR